MREGRRAGWVPARRPSALPRSTLLREHGPAVRRDVGPVAAGVVAGQASPPDREAVVAQVQRHQQGVVAVAHLVDELVLVSSTCVVRARCSQGCRRRSPIRSWCSRRSACRRGRAVRAVRELRPDRVVAAFALLLHPGNPARRPRRPTASRQRSQHDQVRRSRGSSMRAGDARDVVVADEGLRHEGVEELVVPCQRPGELPEVAVADRAPDRLPQLVLGDRVDRRPCTNAG